MWMEQSRDRARKTMQGMIGLPAQMRTRALALLTTPRVWAEYRAELARLHLTPDLASVRAERQMHSTLDVEATVVTAEAWTAAVGELLVACGRRVVVTLDRDGCAHYATRPVTDSDTNPTAETVERLQAASPLASASGLTPRYRAAYPWSAPSPTRVAAPAASIDLSTLDTLHMPSVTPPMPSIPSAPAASGASAAARSGGPTFSPLRMSDLIDDATRARVRALLAAKLAATAATTPDKPAGEMPACEEVDEMQNAHTREKENQPCSL